ncbi:hypothetical protein Tco_1522490, partial [Tanacetum coccineum]
STAKVKTVNGEVQLQALIDGKKVFILEAIIRRDLHLEDAEEVECMPNNEIFEELARMWYEKPPPKLTFYKDFFALQWKFLIHTLIQCLNAKRIAWNEFSSTMASAVIYLATSKKFKFSKYIFDSIVRNVDSSAKFLMYPQFIQVFLDNQVDDMTSHHTKYTSLLSLRRSEDVEMPVDEEELATTSAPSTSKLQDQQSTPYDSPEQERTHSSPHDLPLTGVDDLEKDKLAQATEILSLKKRVKKLEKRRKSKPLVLKRLRKIGSATRVESSEEAMDETQRMDDDLIFNTTADLGGEEVVVKPAETSVSATLDVEVSATEPTITTVSSLFTNDSVTITATEPVSAAAKELTNNDMTMAEALAELKTSKPKVVTTVPILNSAITVELEEEVKRQEEASMAILAELYNVVQAQIDADQELAARMTLEEHERYTVEDRARILAEFIKNRKKQLEVERADAIRSKPPTKDFEEIQGLYNKEKELVDTFVPIGSEEDERRIKDLNTKAEEESSNKDVDSKNKRKKMIRMKRSSKKQKTDDDLKEEEQLKYFLSIVPNEEEAIDYEVLDKRYPIVEWESKFYHIDRYGEPHDYYRVFRADGSSRYIKTFTEMVTRFDRLDFIELYSLVMQRFETTTLEGIDLILWGDLRTMFEANVDDDLWKNQEKWILKSWNFYKNCGVHTLMLEDGTTFYMLAERKYPLTKETLEKMLVLRLTAESESEAAFDLLRLFQKQIDEM